VKKNKQEQYLKDDNALSAYILQSALEDARIYTSADTPAISALALEAIANHYQAVLTSVIPRLARRYPQTILEDLLDLPKLAAESLADRSLTEAWLKLLEEKSSKNHVGNKNKASYLFDITEDKERQLFLPTVTLSMHGSTTKYIFNRDFFGS